jgi:hypothetical protein
MVLATFLHIRKPLTCIRSLSHITLYPVHLTMGRHRSQTFSGDCVSDVRQISDIFICVDDLWFWLRFSFYSHLLRHILNMKCLVAFNSRRHDSKFRSLTHMWIPLTFYSSLIRMRKPLTCFRSLTHMRTPLTFLRSLTHIRKPLTCIRSLSHIKLYPVHLIMVIGLFKEKSSFWNVQNFVIDFKGRRGCYCIVQSIWIIYLNAME